MIKIHAVIERVSSEVTLAAAFVDDKVAVIESGVFTRDWALVNDIDKWLVIALEFIESVEFSFVPIESIVVAATDKLFTVVVGATDKLCIIVGDLDVIFVVLFSTSVVAIKLVGCGVGLSVVGTGVGLSVVACVVGLRVAG